MRLSGESGGAPTDLKWLEREKNVIGLGSLMAIRRWGCSDGSNCGLNFLSSAKGESTRLFSACPDMGQREEEGVIKSCQKLNIKNGATFFI